MYKPPRGGPADRLKEFEDLDLKIERIIEEKLGPLNARIKILEDDIYSLRAMIPRIERSEKEKTRFILRNPPTPPPSAPSPGSSSPGSSSKES